MSVFLPTMVLGHLGTRHPTAVCTVLRENPPRLNWVVQALAGLRHLVPAEAKSCLWRVPVTNQAVTLHLVPPLVDMHLSPGPDNPPGWRSPFNHRGNIGVGAGCMSA